VAPQPVHALDIDPSYITHDERMGTPLAIAWVFAGNLLQALHDLPILHTTQAARLVAQTGTADVAQRATPTE
jgi:hypothetical protein